MKMKLSALRTALELREFNPNQPRVPAGQPAGGQWVGDGSGPKGVKPSIGTPATLLAQNSQEFLDEQYARDISHCKIVGKATCYAQAMVRLVACERGHSIPPLNY